MPERNQISQNLQHWYSRNKRDLPWRDTRDPYSIWLSEIILQQTQVKQGLPYFNKFKSNYPELEDLANASEDKIMRDWQGLGYYSRARNMHRTAKIIQDEKEGIFPDSYDELLKLKGIGPYTAAAVASFAFKEPRAVVDGNVIRVISRIFAIQDPVNESKGLNKIKELAEKILDKKNPDVHNQALMELGALICKPNKPLCGECPLEAKCIGRAQDLINNLPYKSKKIKKRDRYFHYIVAVSKNEILMNKRSNKDIWFNLYDFPLIESKTEISENEIFQKKALKGIGNRGFSVDKVTAYQKHILSHQTIRAKFIILRTEAEKIPLSIADNFESTPVAIEETKDLGKPILIFNFLKKYIY